MPRLISVESMRSSDRFLGSLSVFTPRRRQLFSFQLSPSPEFAKRSIWFIFMLFATELFIFGIGSIESVTIACWIGTLHNFSPRSLNRSRVSANLTFFTHFLSFKSWRAGLTDILLPRKSAYSRRQLFSFQKQDAKKKPTGPSLPWPASPRRRVKKILDQSDFCHNWA